MFYGIGLWFQHLHYFHINFQCQVFLKAPLCPYWSPTIVQLEKEELRQSSFRGSLHQLIQKDGFPMFPPNILLCERLWK